MTEIAPCAVRPLFGLRFGSDGKRDETGGEYRTETKLKVSRHHRFLGPRIGVSLGSGMVGAMPKRC